MNNIKGIPNGVIIGQLERTTELDERILNRRFPSINLKPNYDPRPISTKYSQFPTLSGRKPINEGLKDYNKNAYFNTTKDNPLGPITAHPCLYWAISWPFMWNRAKEFLKEPMTPQEAGRGVHYSEDVIIHQPLKSNTNIKN